MARAQLKIIRLQREDASKDLRSFKVQERKMQRKLKELESDLPRQIQGIYKLSYKDIVNMDDALAMWL